MVRRLPLVDHIHDLGFRNCSCLASANDNIISNGVPKLKVLVSLDAIVLTIPKAKQLAQSTIDREV